MGVCERNPQLFRPRVATFTIRKSYFWPGWLFSEKLPTFPNLEPYLKSSFSFFVQHYFFATSSLFFGFVLPEVVRVLLAGGRWVGVAVCVVSRRVGVIRHLANCRARFVASVWRRHRHGEASCASGRGRGISCTTVHQACGAQCAAAVREETPTDACRTHACSRTSLGFVTAICFLQTYFWATF